MNIFVLDYDPDLSIQYHVDKHVVKMITEHTQLLNTAYYYTNEEYLACYKLSHAKHPCALWCKENIINWMWLKVYTLKLYDEYKYRYGGFHGAGEKCKRLIPPSLPTGHLTKFPQCMPNEYKCDDSVQAYRNYYLGEKTHILTYTGRDIPHWIPKEYHKYVKLKRKLV